jgi:hypothetical protein
MYPKILLKMSLVTIVAITIYSCSNDISDTEAPTITVEEPLANDTAVLSIEDSVHIHFTAEDNNVLKDLNVSITNKYGTNVFSTINTSINSKTYLYHEHFVPTGITSITPFTMNIIATDVSSNRTNKSYTFYVMP